MNFANRISLGRLLIAVISFFLLFDERWVSGSLLLLVAVLLDIADGKVARRFNIVTTQGIFLDVMADKIVIIGTFLVVGYKLHVAFFVLGILMLIREYSIDTMRTIAAAKKKVISADKFSKIKGILFMVAMMGMVLHRAFFAHLQGFPELMIIIASVGMVLAYITLGRFFVKYKAWLLE